MISEKVKNQIQEVPGDITKLQWLEDHADYAMQVIFCCFDARTERVYQARTLQQRKRQDGRGTVSWQAGWAWLPNPVLKME